MSTSPPRDTSPPPEHEDDIVDEEDLMGDNMADDYAERPELDTFDAEDIDNREYAAMSRDARRRAEKEMANRDRREGLGQYRRGGPQALLSSPDDLPSRFFPRARDWSSLFQQGGDEEAGDVNLEDFDAPLREWLDEPRVIREVKRRFKKFLQSHQDANGNPVYPPKLSEMCANNRSSLKVSFLDLSNVEPTLGIWVTDAPGQILEMFDEVAMEVCKMEFPQYESVTPKIYVRISDLPIHDRLRDLRQAHLNAFIQVSGVVTRRTNVFPQLQLVKFDCVKCGNIIGPFAQQTDKEIKPPSCPECQSVGPFRLNESQTIYRNYQKIVLQEAPGSVPAGRIPRSRDVILINDLCDYVKPGEAITVTGIYKNEFAASLNAQQGFPVFSTIIEANNIDKKNSEAGIKITQNDRENIRKLAKDHTSSIEEIIINSIAPSIYGHEYIKRAIMYSLFGGQEKHNPNKHRVRGDINVLILGDPGVAKSQFLKYVEGVASRAVYATGKGASAVGLTASVRRDPMTREWTLEGGALVLADRGICLIDEFDKMNDQDRTSIHEAMEQQSISISKAGIVATLQARCAVIAAANPVGGRYDTSRTFVDNVELTDPILSRFDVLAVVRDKVNPTQDSVLANFVVSSHRASHPSLVPQRDEDDDGNINNNFNNDMNDEDNKTIEDDDEKKYPDGFIKDKNQLTQGFLKKYIYFAKENIRPKLNNINRDKISEFYGELRQQSTQGGGIMIAVRHIESILRMAEARAKLHLREYVTEGDVEMAIRCVLESFIDTQKQSVQSTLRKLFAKYLSYQKDSTELLLHVLEEEVNAVMKWRDNMEDITKLQNAEIPLDIFVQRAKDMKVENHLESFYKSDRFRQEGFKLDRQKKLIIKEYE